MAGTGDTFFILIFLVAMVIIAAVLASSVNKKTGRYSAVNPASPIIENSHAWHEPKGEYGENHADIVDDHVVSHPQPEIGYVVLNGVKRKLEDCKWL